MLARLEPCNLESLRKIQNFPESCRVIVELYVMDDCYKYLGKIKAFGSLKPREEEIICLRRSP